MLNEPIIDMFLLQRIKPRLPCMCGLAAVAKCSHVLTIAPFPAVDSDVPRFLHSLKPVFRRRCGCEPAHL